MQIGEKLSAHYRMQFPTWSASDQPVGSVEDVAYATEVRASAVDESGTHVYSTVVRWTLYATAFLMPLFFLPWTTGVLETNKQLLLAIAAGVGLMAWLLGVVMSGHIRLRPTLFDAAIGGLLLSTLIGTIFSMAMHKSLFGLNVSVSSSLTSVLALSLLYYLIAHTTDDRGLRLKNALIWGALIALVIAFLQIFSVYILPFAFAKSRAFNTVGSVNAVGMFAAILLPLFLKTRLMIRGVPGVDFAKIAALLAVGMLAILNWWALWAVASVGMLAVIGLDSVAAAMAGGTAGRWSMSRFLLPMTVIVLAVFLLVVNFNFSFVKNNLPVEIAPSARLSTDITKNVLKTSTVTGYGPENFYLAFDKFGASALANSTLLNLRFFDAMSEAFTRIVHEGIIGLLAILGLLWVVIRSVLSFRATLSSGRGHTAHVIGIFASVLAATAAFFLYPLNLTLSFALYMLLALAALALPSAGERSVNIEDKPVFSLASSLGFVVGLIVVLTGWYFLGAAYAADTIFANAITLPSREGIEKGVMAANLDSQNDNYYRSLSQTTLALLTDEINKGSRTDPERPARIQNYIQSAINLAQRATQIDARDSNNWLNLGSVYQSLTGLVDGVEKLAEEAYKKAAELRPGDPTFANRVGTMYLARADLDRQLARSGGANAGRFEENAQANLMKAEDAFKEAIALSSNFGMAIYNLGAVYDRQGKTNEAIVQLERIIPANANQPNLLFELGLLYYRVNRKEDSFAALQRAVLISPQFANARWYLALILEERKDFDAALEQLEKILETNKDNETVLAKIADLKAGKVAIPPQRVIDQKPL